MQRGQRLPAPDFCNKDGAGKPNPIPGKGALGNQYTGRMYYTGESKEEYITLVQMMLTDLGYSVGSAGVDGKFGSDTEKAVREFQKVNEDWGGEKLNVDGLVGPETSDALNRAMVGVEGWYDRHETEKELTQTFALMTVLYDVLKQPVPFDVAEMEKGKVVIVRKSGGFVYGTGNLILHAGAAALCPHGGTIGLVAAQSRVLVSGQPVVTLGDTGIIKGCANRDAPCMSAKWFTAATRVFAGGQLVILQSSAGICVDVSGIPKGAVQIVQIQQRATGM